MDEPFVKSDADYSQNYSNEVEKELTPIIRRMDPDTAYNFAVRISNIKAVANLAYYLEVALEQCSLEDNNIPMCAEGLEDADAKVVIKLLREWNREITCIKDQSGREELGKKQDLFENLARIAGDSYLAGEQLERRPAQ